MWNMFRQPGDEDEEEDTNAYMPEAVNITSKLKAPPKPRSGAGFVGLNNQGATCYMNSLLQALFHTPRFRRRLYNWTYKPERDGESEYCIPLALQKLFARLQAGQKVCMADLRLHDAVRWCLADPFP